MFEAVWEEWTLGPLEKTRLLSNRCSICCSVVLQPACFCALWSVSFLLVILSCEDKSQHPDVSWDCYEPFPNHSLAQPGMLECWAASGLAHQIFIVLHYTAVHHCDFVRLKDDFYCDKWRSTCALHLHGFVKNGLGLGHFWHDILVQYILLDYGTKFEPPHL